MSALPDQEFIRVCHVDELPEEGAVKAEVEGRVIAMVRTEDGTVHAIDDTCTHANVSLSEGDVEGNTLECWLHGSCFDLNSGEPTMMPATVPVAVHTVRITEDGDVLVALAS